MFRKLRIIILLSAVLFLQDAMAGEKPVMLFLSSKDQPDTLGYNLVYELPAMLYNEISGGKVALWDSPEKQIRILPASLKGIEEANGISFSKSPQLFIYEKWMEEKKVLSCRIAGFFFSGRNSRGEAISYGFVDYNDVEILLTSNNIKTNADGNCFTTFKYVLLNHLYFYNIVQFGSKTISDFAESQKIKLEYESILSVSSSLPSFSKKVSYVIEKPDAEAVSISAGAVTYEVLKLVEDFLNKNKETYLNLGGDKLSDFMNVKKVNVRSLEVEEVWTKNDSSFDSRLLQVVIMLDKGRLHPVTSEELWKLRVNSDGKMLADLLQKKEFYFRILSMNADKITKEESPKYLKALKKIAWNQVKEYVKYD